MENRNTNKSTALAAIAAALAQNNQTLQVMAEAIREHSSDIEAIRDEITSIKDSLTLHDKGLKEIQDWRNAINEKSQKPIRVHTLRKEKGKEAYHGCGYKPSEAIAGVVRSLIPNNVCDPDVLSLTVWFNTQCRVISGYLYGRCNRKIDMMVRSKVYEKFDIITNRAYAELTNKDGARCVKLFKNRVTAEYLLCATLEVLETAIAAKT